MPLSSHTFPRSPRFPSRREFPSWLRTMVLCVRTRSSSIIVGVSKKWFFWIFFVFHPFPVVGVSKNDLWIFFYIFLFFAYFQSPKSGGKAQLLSRMAKMGQAVIPSVSASAADDDASSTITSVSDVSHHPSSFLLSPNIISLFLRLSAFFPVVTSLFSMLSAFSTVTSLFYG